MKRTLFEMTRCWREAGTLIYGTYGRANDDGFSRSHYTPLLAFEGLGLLCVFFFYIWFSFPVDVSIIVQVILWSLVFCC